MQWLILFDHFMDTNEEYHLLLNTREKEDHDMNMGVSCLTALTAFKANGEKYMLKCHPKPARVCESKSVSVCPRDSASQAGGAGNSSVSKHSIKTLKTEPLQTRSQVGFSDTEMNRVDCVYNECDKVENECYAEMFS